MNSTEFIRIWGVYIPKQYLSAEEKSYLSGLPKECPPIEWVWGEMDSIWKSLRLDNRNPLDGQLISMFYDHPVWLMNGIFTAVDPVSIQHRLAVAEEVYRHQAIHVAEVGGGAGELAMRILDLSKNVSTSLIEPFPSEMLLARVRNTPRLSIQTDLCRDSFDVVIAQDVLEHVEDPIGLAISMSKAVHPGGFVIFANCFYPVIHCHLPSTFHLRYTFHWVMRALGLKYVGRIANAQHVQVFERDNIFSEKRARQVEKLSKYIGPVLNRFNRVKSFLATV